MKKIAIISNSLESVLNYRLDLINDLSSLFEVYVVIPKSNETAKLNQLKAINVSVVMVTMSRKGMNPLSELRLLIALRRAIKFNQIDLIFPCRIKPVIWGSIAARFLGIKYVPFITGLGYTFISVKSLGKRLLHKLIVSLYRFAFKKASTIIFQNKDDLQLFSDLNIVKNIPSVVVNGSGVNCDYFHESPLKDSGAPHFLMVSRLLLEKGIIEYCKAAEVISQQYPEAVFSLVGFFDGSMTEKQKNDMQYLIDASPIQYHGKTDDVRPYIEDCTVFVLPSYREGTPRSILEAMAMKRAIITTDAPGCRQTVNNSVNGFLVSPRSVDQLAYAMEKFCLDESLARSMGKASRQMALAKYEVKQVNKDIIACL